MKAYSINKHILLACITIISVLLQSVFSFSMATEIGADSSAIEVKMLTQTAKDELLNNSDYQYEKIKIDEKSPWDRFWEWVDEKISKLFDGEKGDYTFTIFKYILIAATVSLLIYVFFKNNIRTLFYGKSASVKIDFNEIEEHIDSIDFEKLISDAINKKDFRKAVRYDFLKALKKLSDQNFIQWRVDKTNNDYTAELKNKKIESDFKEMVFIYEYYWYGNFPIDENEYTKCKNKFNAIKI